MMQYAKKNLQVLFVQVVFVWITIGSNIKLKQSILNFCWMIDECRPDEDNHLMFHKSFGKKV
jgi:hypothetical protein